MTWSFISIFISFILGVLAIRYLQRFDVYDREPLWSMVVATVVGGFASVFIGLVLYEITDPLIPQGFIRTFPGAFLVIGPIEEIAKLLGLIIAWFFIRKQITEINDSIIYMACVALGFSLIENYMYSNRMAGDEYLLFIRLFISTPMHITFSVFMGYAIYRIYYEKRSWQLLAIAFIWAVILHGAFDGFLFINMPLLVILLVAISFQQVLAMANFSNYLSPFKLRFANIVEDYTVDQVVRKPCPYCETTTNNDAIKFKKIRLFHCHQCGHYHGKQENITNLLDYLHPRFKFGKKSRELNITQYAGKQVYAYENTIYFTSEKIDKGFFKMADITGLTIRMKKQAEEKFRKSPYSPAKYFVD
ncbi:MAG: PrsW family intramembrane metalloprotease [Bacteroidales bacterium]|nr:PrsW family intramembrane metalloprotease [Bacteroidales bacterium]